MNSFGKIFNVSIIGESHGRMVGVCLDGVPAGIPINEQDFLPDLERRKPKKKGTTPRKESNSITSNGFCHGARAKSGT